MAKVRVSASISEKLAKEAKLVAERRGMKFSQMVERALINEINKKSDNGIKAELEDIKQIIEEKISLLEVVDDESVTIVGDVESHVKDIVSIYDMFGMVDIEIFDVHAGELGMEAIDLIKLVKRERPNLRIDSVAQK